MMLPPGVWEEMVTKLSTIDEVKQDQHKSKRMAGITSLQAKPNPPILRLRLTVLHGRKITNGKWEVSVPIPYVTMKVTYAFEQLQRTESVTSSSPEWNETFLFHCNPLVKSNALELQLHTANWVFGGKIGEESIQLEDLPQGKQVPRTLKFGTHQCEVDICLEVFEEKATDMRYSSELCDQEKSFLQQRKRIVFESMKTLLGERGPRDLSEVPTVAVLGSGGGYRATMGYCGSALALEDMKMLDCVTYMAGLSGSAWYVSTLYSQEDGSAINPSKTLSHLRDRFYQAPFPWLSELKKHDQEINEKEKRGQPTSFTDAFGYYIGDVLLAKEAKKAKVTQQRVKISNGYAPLPIYTSLHVQRRVKPHIFSEWVEHTPFETGMANYDAFGDSELIGNSFFFGKNLKKFPEFYLHYLQGIWGSAYAAVLVGKLYAAIESRAKTLNIKSASIAGGFGEFDKMVFMQFPDEGKTLEEAMEGIKGDGREEMMNFLYQNYNEETVVGYGPGLDPGKMNVAGAQFLGGAQFQDFALLSRLTRPLAAIFNFNYSPEPKAENENNQYKTTNKDKIFVVDAGLAFNSPYPPLLRPERAVDLFLSFEFSARETDDTAPFEELKLAEKWAKENNVRFPPINCDEQFKKDGMKECYVFKDPADTTCPIVLHFVLVNKTYRDYSEPGKRRVTPAEKKQGDFNIFNAPFYERSPYSTFKLSYTKEEFDRLAGLMKFNTLLNKELIKSSMADCVENIRKRNK